MWFYELNDSIEVELKLFFEKNRPLLYEQLIFKRHLTVVDSTVLVEPNGQ